MQRPEDLISMYPFMENIIHQNKEINQEVDKRAVVPTIEPAGKSLYDHWVPERNTSRLAQGTGA